MYGPGSSKKNGVGGLNRKLPFLNVHNWQKGRCRSLTYIIGIPLLTNGILQYCCPVFLLCWVWEGFGFGVWGSGMSYNKKRKQKKKVLVQRNTLVRVSTLRWV